MKARVGTSFEEVAPAFSSLIQPLVEVIEIIPDSLAVKTQDGDARIPASTLETLAELSRHVPLVVHGVGLSIGSWRGWNEGYFKLLDQLLEVVPVAWHSEHLGFTHIDGKFSGTMLTLPRTQEALDLVLERARRIRERYPLPFLLENIVNLLPDPPAAMSEAAFLNQLSRDSGCGLLLDVYNLRCNAHNQGYGPWDFLDELDLSQVWEIHVAGGVERAGLMLDIHSRCTHETTRQLLAEVVHRCPNLQAVIFEIMAAAVPVIGHQAWANEVSSLQDVVTA
jgi:uncharacterized protein (UPF0276 family)